MKRVYLLAFYRPYIFAVINESRALNIRIRAAGKREANNSNKKSHFKPLLVR
jgi:hypothetical protein